MTWPDPGRVDAFGFQRISWPSMRYAGTIDHITGGSLTKSAGTSLKVSASLTTCQMPDIGNDLVRIICRSTDNSRTTETVLGTLFASCPSTDILHGAKTGTVSLYSTLVIPEFKRTHQTLNIPAGTNAIEWARKALADMGLTVTASPSRACLNVAKTYEGGTSYLEIINDLCDFASYGSAAVGPYGNVVLTPYLSPAAKTTSYVIRDDEPGIIAPAFSIQADYFNTPNVVVMVCSNADRSLTSTATFDSPAHFLSTRNRYEVTAYETVSDVTSQAALDAKCRARLHEKLSYIERTTVTHPWQPADIGDVWELYYTRLGLSLRGSIYEQDIELVPGMRSKTVLRRVMDVG